MKAEEFNRVLNDVFREVENVLLAKAGEYADDVDRLRNFKQAAHLKEETPREALMGMMAKHTISVYDMGLSGVIYPLSQWDEKIIDHINYLILLRALVVDELEGKTHSA